MNREEVIQSILEAGKDGWGDSSPSDLQASSRCAAEFVRMLPETVAAPAVTEGDEGGLALEWRSGEDGMLRIEFGDGDQAVYQVCSGGMECRGEAESVSELAKLIGEAMGS